MLSGVIIEHGGAHFKGFAPAKKLKIRIKPSAVAQSFSAVGSGTRKSRIEDPQWELQHAVEQHTFRFWHEERKFKGTGERSLMQLALYEAGGVRTGGYPKAAPVPGPLGSERMEDWDMLWSPVRCALKAAPHLKSGQLISAVPGMYSLTRKGRLAATLRSALGHEGAREIVPESYTLPAESDEWEQLLESDRQARESLWILKTGQHLGKGLVLLPGAEALQESKRPRPEGKKPFVVVQRYVDDPMLIRGCKFGIRVWVLVSGTLPFRAYMHTNCLVLFSTQPYDDSRWLDDQGISEGHITNYSQNVNGLVWSGVELKQHLGEDAYNQLWTSMLEKSSSAMMAAIPHVRQEFASLKLLGNSAFELLGLDYLVDSSLNPWLLEVNGTPSLAVEHTDPGREAVIFQQKMGMVRDMVKLLDMKNRFVCRYQRKGESMTAEALQMRRMLLSGRAPNGEYLPPVREEISRRAGWIPLMPFPWNSGSPECRSAMMAQDSELDEWMDRISGLSGPTQKLRRR